MATDFTLIDQATLAAVDNFDRVFQGNDVQRPLVVELVEQRRQRAGLATAGRPTHQDQAFTALRKNLKHIRQVELIQRGDTPRDQAKGDCRAIQLAKQVQAKAPKHRQRQGQVQFITL
ncbi:hypothetical protein D9M71_714710 [compost metagenome]